MCIALLIQWAMFSKVRTRQKKNKIRNPRERVPYTDWLENAFVLQPSSYKPESCFITTKPECQNQNSEALERVLTASQGFASVYSSLFFLEFHRLFFLIITKVQDVTNAC